MRSDDRLVLTCFAIVLGCGVLMACLVTMGSIGMIGWTGTVLQETSQAYQTKAVETEQAYQVDIKEAEMLFDEAKDWEVVFSDSFDTNENGWEDDAFSYDLVEGEVEVADGKYYWDMEAIEGFIYYDYPEIDVLGDFYVEVEAEQSRGPVNGQYGLIFLYASGNYYYYFTITEDRRFQVYLLRVGKWESIIPLTFSEAIQPGEKNKLAIIAIEEDLYFYINDAFVQYVGSSLLLRGRVGLLTGLRLEGDTAEFAFDNFEVRVPPDAGE